MPSPEARVLRVPNIRRAQRADWQQLVRFCVVGASGYLVNLAVFSVLVHVVGAHYALAAVGAFCVAWTNNFALEQVLDLPTPRPVGGRSRERGTWP